MLPVWKINVDKGEKETVFQVPAEFQDGYRFATYAVSPTGLLTEAVVNEKTGETELLRFASDGSYTSRARLSVPKFFHVEYLAIFDTEQMFIAGYVASGGPKALVGRPTVAIFSPDGELVKKISALQASQKKDSIDPREISERSVAMGGDGNLYYLRGREVAVISPGGDLVRRLLIERPEKEYVPVKLDFSEGVVSVRFMKPMPKQVPTILMRTFDSNTGELLAEYSPGEG
jgi:hypothetical protein